MKRFLQMACAGLFVATMAAPSLAADLRTPYKAPPPVYVAPFSWSGFYVGLNAGYGWGHSDWNNGTMGNVSMNVKGWMVGGTLGYNLQTGSFVWGLETDLDWTRIRGSSQAGGAGTPCGAPNGCETRNDYFGTFRGRIGYAMDRFLPYITGGAAYGNIKATGNAGSSVEKTQFGWTAGAGLEYAFMGPWSAKIEYLYADLGHITCDAPDCTPSTSVSWKTNIVRLGVNYRF